MLKLDNDLLQEIGLGGLPEDQKKAMLQHIYETLELRVGTQLANQMTDKQLEEFERFIDQGGDQDQAEALKWLETNLPNYKQVVNDVFEALKVEIKQMAPQIMASVPQQAAGGPAPSMPLQGQDNQAMPQQAQPQQYQQPQAGPAQVMQDTQWQQQTTVPQGSQPISDPQQWQQQPPVQQPASQQWAQSQPPADPQQGQTDDDQQQPPVAA